MDSLYAKLFDRYKKLKCEKFGDLEHLNEEQEEKFINHVAAADELVQHLRDENDRLRTKVNDLIIASAAARSTVDNSVLEHQKLLMEETHKNKELSQKNKELSQEVERLGKMQNEEGDHVSTGMSNGDRRTRSKRKRDSDDIGADSIVRPQDNGGAEIVERHSKRRNCLEETMSPNNPLQQPKCCCGGVIGGSGDWVKGTCGGDSKCLFRELIQYVLGGMQFSVVSQNEGNCIRTMHESSGYCFRLTWMMDKKATGGGGGGGGGEELMYNVESLGTYERVAPEWMREVIKFSTTMIPTFFERITRVIKLHHHVHGHQGGGFK